MEVTARCLCLVLAASTAGACAHSRPTVNPFVHGKVPEYQVPLPAGDKGLPDFVSQVNQAQAEARATRGPRPPAHTIEATDDDLRAALTALAVAPTADAYRRAAAEYARLGVNDVAMDYFTSAIRLAPRDAASFEMRARIWRDWGLSPSGLADAYRALYFAPRSASPYNTLGTLFHRMGRYSDARANYEHALSIEPAAAYVLNNLCVLAIDEGRASDAVTACRQALDHDANLGAAQRNLATAAALLALTHPEARDAR